MNEQLKELMAKLSAPFDANEVQFKPGAVSGNRALAMPYVTSRVIMDRLDTVLGVGGWSDEYEVLADGSVVCRLRCRIGDEWVVKTDVGSPSEQPDEGDRVKAAFSDALKRAAVKYGMARYLYRLPNSWVDYDPQRRQFVRPPALPPAAAPPRAAVSPRPPAQKSAAQLPANGTELQRRLYDYDAKLTAQGLCVRGDLVKYIIQAGVKAGHDSDLSTWSADAIVMAVDETKAFEASCRSSELFPLPKDGTELERRTRRIDARLSAQRRCAEGELLAYVRHVGDEEHFPRDLARWDPQHFPEVAELVKRWIDKLPPPAGGAA